MFRKLYRVLIVDSTTIDRKLLQNYLAEIKGSFYECEEAVSLHDATQKVSQNPGRFDLAILDLRLIDSDGLATFESFHRMFPDMPCVIMSTRNDQDIIQRALKIGAHDYLIKGQFGSDRLRKAISLAVKVEIARKLINVK